MGAGTGSGGWLEVITTPNADVGHVRRVIDERGLHVSTSLDHLADRWLSDDPKLSRVLLVAHAGDGKTEFLQRVMKGSRSFDECCGEPRWDESERWVMNDPSLLSTDRVVAFLQAAFGGTVRARFVAGINRGLLRAMIARPEIGEDARGWLTECLQGNQATLAGDERGRLCVPLDRRALVPATMAASAEGSPAGRLARKIFSEVAGELTPAVGWDAEAWGSDIARVLALAEASGHHVTFREVLGLSAAVAMALRDAPSEERPREALAALFGGENSTSARVPSLAALRRVLRRIDPARAAHPRIDVLYRDGTTRDRAVRERWLGGLSRKEHSEATFLRLCEGTRDKDVEQAEQVVRVALARLAWKGDSRMNERDPLLPLTTGVHPGTTRDDVLALRGVLDLATAHIKSDHGPQGEFIEKGMRAPALVVDVPKGQVAPRLALDLEMFQMLRRAAEVTRLDRAALGPRVAQVDAWLDGLAAAWAGSLGQQTVTGLVTFQSFLGGGEPIALRPSKDGAPVRWPGDASSAGYPSAEAALRDLHEKKVLLSPGACATALLRWAGLTPQDPGRPRAATRMEQEACGAAPATVQRSSGGLRRPLFPWSSATLGLALEGDGDIEKRVWASVSPTLGATLARSLGLTGPAADWAGALRAAWRDDEPDFDRHPSGRLVHRWLDHGIDGLQLGGIPGARLQRPPVDAAVRLRGVHDLLAEDVPFPRSQRWWLLGTWAAWALLLDALGEVHNRPLPVLLPSVQGVGAVDYQSVRDAWWQGDKRRDPLRWAGQASEFLQPPRATKHIDLPLDGPLLNVLLVVAHTVDRDGGGRPEHRTVTALQRALLEAGVYLQPPGERVQHRVPEKALQWEAPPSVAFGELLRTTLQRMGMLDAASDGATLFRAPWQRRG